MNITYLASSYWPNVGGSALVTKEITIGLTKRGHAVNFLVPNKYSRFMVLRRTQPQKPLLGLKVEPFGPRLSGFASDSLGYIFLLLKTIPAALKAHVILTAHHPSNLNSFCAALTSRITRKPLVIRADDLVAKPSTRLQRLLNLLLYLLSYWSFHQATKVLVPSDELTDVARRMFRLDQSDVAVSYNGVDRERFSNTRQIGPRLVWRRSHTVVFSGALSALRGVDILLRAIPAIKKAVPDLEVVILGDGPDLPRLVEISESLQLRDCVHFLGSVPPDTVSKHLSVARVAIGPLRASSQTFGAFPIKVLEYMAAGCVVVAGVQTVSSRLVSDRVNGLLVKPGDPIDLARAILTIFSDDRLAERIGQKGRETASRYGWEIVVSQLERTLLSALDFGGIKADGST